MRPDVRPSLRDALSAPDTKRTYVRRLFSVIADRYDLITVVLSYGQDRKWKRRLVAMAGSQPPARVLDLACGTGDIAFEMAAAGWQVTGLDITPRMLEIARDKPDARRHRVGLVAGDMMALPFPDATFRVVTTGYGLRNVPELPVALAEIERVLVPGGLLLSLDFDRPSNPVIRGVYLAYLTIVGSVLGAILHGEPDTYRYIPESIRRYPGAAGVSALACRAGFRSCAHQPVLGGFMAIHSAVK
jgi:demethylmenaquinone methyltransferase/2-methoxy-6-polyprenyl-1,4-benzoquinol methylase